MPIHRRARLGLSDLPQESSVFRKLTVEENVLAVLELQVDAQGRPLGRPEVERRLEALLEELQIGTFDRTRPCRSPAGNAAGWRSPGSRQPHPASCCWTNLSPVSIPSR
jgi:lipopolysaccharide export system ATP-binding protein